MFNFCSINELLIRDFGKDCDYPAIWQRAINFSQTRDFNTPDELWLFECQPIFTAGLNNENVAKINDAPVIQMDRDGKHTYHGPGQLMFGTILDLNRRNLKPAKLVYILYDILMQLLIDYGLTPALRNQQHQLGPWINDSKIGFVDLGLLNGCCYHGMSVNIDMDLSQFSRIVPCGVENLTLTQLKDHIADIDLPTIKRKLSELFIQRMGYSMVIHQAA